MDKQALTGELKSAAQQLGFALCGVCAAAGATGIERFRSWLDRGYDGEMAYLGNRVDAYADPNRVLPGVRSLVMLALPYRTSEPLPTNSGEGRISRYAWSARDYHDVIHARLKRLSRRLRELVPGVQVRGVVDTAPLLEREHAQRAGLGWIGKNTLLLNKEQGSWFFLAALLTDLELEYDSPHATDHCGTCRLCLDACPTRAFPEPYLLDATRCISYLTIELRGSIPAELRPGLGDWLFGCDVCQEVCPWNRRAPPGEQATFGPEPGRNPIPLGRLFELDEQQFREQFRGTSLWRSRRRGILRNAAIVLGNHRSPDSIPPLARGLNDEDPLVRGACAWALGQIGTPAARQLLRDRLEQEQSPEVRTELSQAGGG